VVRDAALLVERHLVGADVEAPIDGGRIAGDDFPAEALGQRQRQRALAGGGRADDREQQRAAQGQRTRATAYPASAVSAR
jgi:hypothetical protein